MERGIMTINRNGVTITGNVWMTDFEIAELFSVTLPAVNSRIKSIYKSGVLSENDTYRYIRLENGNRADAYNMEMITALAFQLNSQPAKVFREWIVRKAVLPQRTHSPIVIQLKVEKQTRGKPQRVVCPLSVFTGLPSCNSLPVSFRCLFLGTGLSHRK